MGLSLLRFGNRRSSRPFCGLSSYLPRAQLQAAQGLQWFHQEKFCLFVCFLTHYHPIQPSTVSHQGLLTSGLPDLKDLTCSG